MVLALHFVLYENGKVVDRVETGVIVLGEVQSKPGILPGRSV